MDWHKQSAGSRGECVSWVAGQAHSCISLVLEVMKTAFHGDKMDRKYHCCITTGQIKAMNFTEHLSFSFSNKTEYYSWCWLKNDPQSVEIEVAMHEPTHMEFVVHIQQLGAFCHLIKQKREKYSPKNQLHNNTLLHILSHTKQSETDTPWNTYTLSLT